MTASSSNTSPVVALFDRQKQLFSSLRLSPIDHRKLRLRNLRKWIHENRNAIHEAMFSDFSKAPVEVDATEVFHVLNEIKFALQNLDEWTAPKKIDAPITMLGTRSFIQYEPKGVCLIIAPWNYPFSLAVGPLVSALAAGNTVIIKPSELTPNVSALIQKMTTEIFKDGAVETIQGDAEVARQLLQLPFDHIFFTGSPTVGKVVMKAAAENLSSITLELGGKSPAVVVASANINDAATRIAVAKFINNGQTCIAPDYILVDEKIGTAFIEALIEQTKKLFTEKNQPFQESKSYCRIVNQKHFYRLEALLKDALTKGAKLEFGGDLNATERFISPTILSNVSEDCQLLHDEIFGPLLPIITYQSLDDAVAIINAKPKPLALYIFSNKKIEQQQVLEKTSSGGVCINDCAIHFLHHHLPFGGVNNSGIGKSHGHYGFLAFSNEKAVLKQKGGFTSVTAFYPPYTSVSKKLMDWFLKMF